MRSNRSATTRCCCASTTATRAGSSRGTCSTRSAATRRGTGRRISTRSMRRACSAAAENAPKDRIARLASLTGERAAMPEEIEIDTDSLRETIDREIEREAGGLLSTIALTTALFAALAAIASLEAGGTVNEALALKTEATRLQAEASDQWSYYQAKGLKAAVADAQKNIWVALDKAPPAELAANAAR